jgi:Holliday junction resolvase RusA-like endonuclease
MERAGCDLDDRLKVYFDALNGVLFDDDEQVAEYGDVRRIVDGKRPGIQATFTPIAVDRYGAPT